MGMRESYKALARAPAKTGAIRELDRRFRDRHGLPYRDRHGAPPPDQPVDRTELVSRRRLLQLAGTAGLVAAASACSTEPPAHPSSSPSPSPTATAARSPAAIPPPEPLTSTAPTLSAPPAVMLCRDAWGARPARPGGTPHTLTHLTIHHSAVVLGDNSNAPGRIRQDQRYHQDTQGWIDIAYHVGVDRNGNIYELRSPELVGDTATTYDPTGHFLVLCEGDFDKEEVTEELLHGTALACAWAAQRFAIPTATLRPQGFRRDLLPGREPLRPPCVRRSQATRRGPRRRWPRRSAADLWSRGNRHRRGYRGWPSLAAAPPRPTPPGVPTTPPPDPRWNARSPT